jgi:quinoprotein glucose dehydrogenase
VRVDALQALLALDPERGLAAIVAAAADPDPAVRKEGVRLAPRLEAGRAVGVLKAASEEGPLEVRQAALAALSGIPGEPVDALFAHFLDRLLEGSLAAALHLDVLEGASRRNREILRERLARYEAKRRPEDPLGANREALEGGDAATGRKIFFERSTVACLRCHKAEGKGGDVGPPLDRIAKDRTREQILESILFPNRQITQGYGQEILRTASDTVEVGRIRSETDSHLVLVLADGREKRLAKADLLGRKPGLSAMPDDIAKSLTKRDLRDLVAYLSGLR